jgi:hypothetical protein
MLKWKDVYTTKQNGVGAYIVQFVALKSSESFDDEMILERDSCSSYGWKQIYLNMETLNVTENGMIEFNLTGLIQVTTYAFTIQTQIANYYTDSNETMFDGGVSGVKIFKTDLRVPSRVKDLKSTSKTNVSIEIQWEVESNEVEAIDFFSLDIIAHPFNQTSIDQRDFCANPFDANEIEIHEVYDDDSDDSDSNMSCCERCCAFDKERKKIQLKSFNDFENALIKFSEKTTRNSLEPSVEFKKHLNFVSRTEIEGKQRTFLITNLSPLTSYMIFLRACGNGLKCGDYSLATITTESSPNDPYDRVYLRPASDFFESEHFHIFFDQPKFVNGALLNYVTEIVEVVDNSTIPLRTNCITKKQHAENQFK